ncbi:MAG: phosphoenolpyruvate carboxylase [Lewinellaceae bacterium]|nr:phosphoenolpyruvate carboxylase [Lewinellaceae bacterium]
MNVDTPSALLYHTYNSLFLSLPFRGIEDTGTKLALFNTHCKEGLKEGKSPLDIIDGFWKGYADKSAEHEKLNQLFYFIQYAERQVVLFDSVEDALFLQTHEMDGPGSAKHLLTRLDSQEEREKLLEKIRDFNLRLVLTAHPTQFYPGKVLGIINDLGNEIRTHDLQQIRHLLVQLGKTAFVNREKPTPYDEAISLGWFLENIFYHAIPHVVFRLLRALGEDVRDFENPGLVALGFWPGGDRDGNPFVTADTTLLVAKRLKEGIFRCYYRDIRQLRRRLTFRGVEDHITRTESKIYNTLYKPEEEKRYHACSELLDDLYLAREAMLEDPDSLHLQEFMDQLDQFILKVRIFGFYFASLDIRQDSRKHHDVWEAILQHWREHYPSFTADAFEKAEEIEKIDMLLTATYKIEENDFSDPFVKETLRAFRAITDIQRMNGETGCHRYIISNCQTALNVAEVLALARLTIGAPETGAVNLDIAPLFETVEDLATCGDVMRRLYTNRHYAAHLKGRNNIQHVMLGFSDGTKDGGYLRANWSIYCAKEELTRISREYGVTVIFFDGRGGPPGRGGGNNASFYAAHGKEIENKAIHVTIQGQTVSSTYGTRESAVYNIERLLTAGLENHMFPDPTREITDDERTLMNEMAEAAYKSYLSLKNHPDFVPYLENMTPLRWYGDTNIASRPTKRGGGQKMRFEDLRAIPFVGAWAQMKQNVPGYFGLGSALSAFGGDGFRVPSKLYRESLFFRTLVENSMQSLLKSNFALTRYISRDGHYGAFWKILFDEYSTTHRALEAISGQKMLLSDNPNSRISIELREEIVRPLIVIQQYALQKLRQNDLSAEESDAYRNLVLRAMFGIINAARNAA